MDSVDNPELQLLATFAKSLGIGLLIGLERERHSDTKAGLRTFALIALAGTLFALIGEKAGTPWLLAVGAAIVGAMLIVAYAVDTAPDDDPGTTTVIAALTTFALGAALWYGYSTLAVALAIVIAALLYFRTELHGVSRQLTPPDYVAFLQLAVLAFILLPVLPDRDYGPFGAINPYRIGMLILLISGIGFAGYVALRIFGENRGALLAGIFGGVASTTATTLAYARQVHRDNSQTAIAVRIILIANLVLYVRLAIFVIALAPALLALLLPIFGGGLLAGAAYLFWLSRRDRHDSIDSPHTDISNPAELRVAFGFALMFTLIVFVVSWLNQEVGMAGVYATAFVAGLTDLDAIALSALRLHNAAQASAPQATLAILIAFVANLIFKLGIAGISGSRALGRDVGAGFLVMAAGMALGWGVASALG